jgi:hypothetical protein
VWFLAHVSFGSSDVVLASHFTRIPVDLARPRALGRLPVQTIAKKNTVQALQATGFRI